MHKQKGLTVVGWMFVIGISLFFAIIAMKMVPHYTEFASVSRILESLKEDPQTNKSSLRELEQAFDTRLNINNIYDFQPEWFYARYEGGEVVIGVDYEIEEEIAGNVKVVMSFQKEVRWDKN